jgi:hypothetical protein
MCGMCQIHNRMVIFTTFEKAETTAVYHHLSRMVSCEFLALQFAKGE